MIVESEVHEKIVKHFYSELGNLHDTSLRGTKAVCMNDLSWDLFLFMRINSEQNCLRSCKKRSVSPKRGDEAEGILVPQMYPLNETIKSIKY